MKRKLSYHFFLFLLAGTFCVCDLPAQETIPDTARVEATPAEDYETNDDESAREDEPYYHDTLISKYRSIIFDSVQAIATDRGFYYKKYMDSLLRATQVKAQRPRRTVNLNGGGFFDSIFGIIFWVAAIALFGFLIYKLFLSNSAFLSRNRKNIAADIAVTTEENTADPDSMLRSAIRSGNYRLAIRYLYLQTLTKLSERKFIELDTNKTNYEYVNEVRKHKFANEFASLTLHYEYVWYGEYPVDERLFEQLQNGFIQFNKNFTR